MKLILSLMLLFSTCPLFVHGAQVIADTLKQPTSVLPGADATKKLLSSAVEEKQKLLTTALKEKEQALQNEPHFLGSNKKRIDDLAVQITAVNQQLNVETDDYEFLNKILPILNENYQICKDIQQLWEQILSLLEKYIKVLQDFIQDPELKNYRKEHALGEKLYSFEELQDLSDLILDLSSNIANLAEQEKHAALELENRKQTAATTQEMYRKLTKEEGGHPEVDASFLSSDAAFLDSRQKALLLNYERQLHADKKRFDDLHLQEIGYKIAFIKMKSFVAKLQLDTLKEELRRVKSSVRVSETDVLFAKEELEQKRQHSFTVTERYRHEIEKILSTKEVLTRELTQLSRRYNVQLGSDLDEWSKEPKPTVMSYVALCQVGYVNDQLLLLSREKEYRESLLGAENQKMHLARLLFEIKDSFYRISARKFATEDEINKEIRRYDPLKADIKANISLYKEKKAAAAELLNIQKKALTNIKRLKVDVEMQKDELFGKAPKELVRCLALLNAAEENVKIQLDILGKTSKVYADINSIANKELKSIDFIIAELGSITIWHRPANAISLEGLKNILSDVETFILDVRAYASKLSVIYIIEKFNIDEFSTTALLIILLKVALLFGMLLVFWLYLPTLAQYLLSITGSLQSIGMLMGCVLLCIHRYFVGLSVWLLTWIAFRIDGINDQYLFILFYLLSIPYLLYLTNRFIAHLATFNVRYGYIFIGKSFQYRFIFTISLVLYATIILHFFRQAFILSSYHKSELPTILWALNFIIFQLSFIGLISKDQVLSLIPAKGDISYFIRDLLDRYYYILICAIAIVIVMINPHVGFGRLVFYVLSGLVYSAIVVRLLFGVQSYVKNALSKMFFESDEEIVRERFSYAKTWYGLFVILIFLVFVGLGLILGAWIWGWSIDLEDFSEWLNRPILHIADANPLTMVSLFKIVMFIFSGFLASFAMNRFVLGKIFDLLLVDVGVQNTISSIAEYLIIITGVLLGFYNAGLGSLVGYLIGALILSIGWVIKEPVSDFIAYFILLVQRPLKIGDFVRMDDDIKGVVRKITPRAVVIRKNNSVSVVIPNTSVINKPLFNWNYVQNFIAFDDIFITVAFKEDPVKVKELLMKVVSSNPNILKNPKPIIRLEEFKEYGYNFLIRGFLSSDLTLEQWDIASDVRFAIVESLREHNVEIASPMEILRTLTRTTMPR